MRLLKRNAQPIWWANFDSYTDDGIAYTNPQKAMWNVSVVESNVAVDIYGVALTDVIKGVPPKEGFPLTETSVIWYGVTPTIEADGSTQTPYNYCDIRVLSTLNTLTFYAKKVNLS